MRSNLGSGIEVLAVVALLALAGCADRSAPAADQAAGSTSQGKSVCITNHDIRNTEILRDHSILFKMNDGKIWRNVPVNQCVTLTPGDGFAYATSIDEICSNLMTVQVLRTGETCMLGEFTPYTPPPKP